MEGSNRGTSVLPLPTGLFNDPSYSAELQELQGAVLGRKFGFKDRRPLDPPPVVKLRIFRTYLHPITGVSAKVEVKEYIPHTIIGCVCHCDLFRLSPPKRDDTSARNFCHPTITYGQNMRPPSDMVDHIPSFPDYTPSGVPAVAVPTILPLSGRFENGASLSSVSPYVLPPQLSSTALPDELMVANSQPRTLPYAQPHLSSAGVNCTAALFGSKITQVRNVEYEKKATLLFVFGDLAVQQVGYFCLRYRFFDLFSRSPTQGQDSPLLAECYGSPFRIYDSKEFPGLPPSTDLTLLVAKQGLSVHTRQHQRKRKDTGADR